MGGSGIHSHLNAGLGLADSATTGSYETGWDATDWNEYIAAGADAASTWNTNLSCGSSLSTWTPSAGPQENLPITCVDWYEAYAFCIWDGGFLPSEAEWEYAAIGGNQQREYPWGSTLPGTSNQYAIYDCNYPPGSSSCAGTNVANMAPVGTATLGMGQWGQFDLAGEAWEWNLDWYANYMDPCTDCAYMQPGSVPFPKRVFRGGSDDVDSTMLLPVNRYYGIPTDRIDGIGFRCARTP